MPVRKIPKNYLTVTGSFASRKNSQMNDFESLLEKEYMLLLDFDEQVERYEPQPVTIHIPRVPKGYTPDVLVFYLPDQVTGEVPKPLLVEVKHTKDLARNAVKYEKKFLLAEEYAHERGWEFRTKTEIDIRTPRLANLKFLREYRNISPSESDLANLMQVAMRNSEDITPGVLLSQLTDSDEERLYWLPVIWHAVVTQQLLASLDQPLNYDTNLCVPEDIL